MPSKKTREPFSTKKRISPFNCPSCGSMEEIVRIYATGKEELICAKCGIDKDKYTKKQIASSNKRIWQVSKACSECGSKKRYSQLENGQEVTRCAKCHSAQD